MAKIEERYVEAKKVGKLEGHQEEIMIERSGKRDI